MKAVCSSLLGAMTLSLLSTAAMGVEVSVKTRCVDKARSICYCVTSKFEPLIDEKIALFRARIADGKSKGKLAGYLSLPMSTRGGGYFALNVEIAEKASSQVSALFGEGAVVIVNPASSDGNLEIGTENASQPDYLFMWSSILWGAEDGKPDIDFIYFLGPSDFRSALHVGVPSIAENWASEFEKRVASDSHFASLVSSGKIAKRDFIAYYTLRASATVSLGAHDEWNVVTQANKVRRATLGKDGVATQVAMWFDGKPVSPLDYESTISAGNVGTCGPGNAVPKAPPIDPNDRRAY
jgi:hypothetical protein